ncbi:hypothetical protein OH76DRAFT_1487119 [Lentinus brumalis]|uniref:C2H2-type domain-containing protein n=1 Tax=Lentinus brumalis TaxID=2498619 RepID=A0A371CVU2_9APHY|nr:hypothetical protein OH76DRAFT_1487119 [Polyporus brumalis]
MNNPTATTSTESLPSTTELNEWFAQFDAAIALLPPDERAQRIAYMSDILDQALPDGYAQDYVSLQPQLPLNSLPMAPTTPTFASDSPADTSYEALTPYSDDATVLASPTGWDSPGEKTFEGGPQSPGLSEEADDYLPEGWNWYDLRQSHDGSAALSVSAGPLLSSMYERTLVASGEEDTWNGEQQGGGLPAAPYESSHAQDEGVNADTSAVTSPSIDVPVPDKKSRKRKTTETSGLEDAGAKPKKPKAQHVCPYEDCSRVYTRKHNLQQHINSKHLELRPFKCPAEGCKDAFAREHDATRHFQSDHTTLGSPRKIKPPPKSAAKAKN